MVESIVQMAAALVAFSAGFTATLKLSRSALPAESQRKNALYFAAMGVLFLLLTHQYLKGWELVLFSLLNGICTAAAFIDFYSLSLPARLPAVIAVVSLIFSALTGKLVAYLVLVGLMALSREFAWLLTGTESMGDADVVVVPAFLLFLPSTQIYTTLFAVFVVLGVLLLIRRYVMKRRSPVALLPLIQPSVVVSVTLLNLAGLVK